MRRVHSLVRSAAVELGGVAPLAVIRRLLRQSLAGRNVALCLHRVRDLRFRPALLPEQSARAEEIDALVETLLECGDQDRRWLTVSFDDGYRDAAEYLRVHARRYPEVEWLFFVCPKKVELRSGFRWDLAERSGRFPSTSELGELLVPGAAWKTESARPELIDVGRSAQWAQCDLVTCLKLERECRITLGNHTNGHHRATNLGRNELAHEYFESSRDFERLFGPQRHFAFPFGAPREDVNDTAVELARASAPGAVLWTTEPRGFEPEDRKAGAVLPRFAVNGTWSWRSTALRIANRAREDGY